MIIVMKKPAELRIAGYNSNEMTQKQEEELRKSLQQFGFVEPIIVNSHPKRRNIIIGGHQRVMVARKMKLQSIPAVEIPLSLEKERELNIRLNRNHGQWSMKLLQEHFDVTELLNWGFEKKELTFDVVDAVDGDPEAVRTNVEVAFKLGDLRFTIPQAAYTKWLDGLVKKVGVKKEAQVAELKSRLLIQGNIVRPGRKAK